VLIQPNENSAATTNVEAATVSFLIFCFMDCLCSASNVIAMHVVAFRPVQA
jgi:hypothetical protein